MKEMGLAMKTSEVGVTEENIPDIVEATLIMKGGYRVLTEEEIGEILRSGL